MIPQSKYLGMVARLRLKDIDGEKKPVKRMNQKRKKSREKIENMKILPNRLEYR